MPHVPKGTYKRALHNPNSMVAPNYSIVEDSAQTPCVMYSLEVLKSCLSQWNTLLSTLGNRVLSNDQVVLFDVSTVKPLLHIT